MSMRQCTIYLPFCGSNVEQANVLLCNICAYARLGRFLLLANHKKKIPINPFNACCNRYTYSFDRKELSVSPCRIVEFSSPSLEVIVSRQH